MYEHLQTVKAYRELNGRTRTEYEILCATKPSRERCAAKVAKLAAECGWTCETNPGWLAPREIRIELTSGGYRCALSFIGGSKVGAFLAHWHTDTGSDAKYPDGFCAGSVNRFHHRKATTCEDSWPRFVETLRAGMTQLGRA